jgi:hypothetical protein
MTNNPDNSKPLDDPLAPKALVEMVAGRSGRSIHTVKSVIYRRVTSAPVSRVIDQVREEMGIPDPRRITTTAGKLAS